MMKKALKEAAALLLGKGITDDNYTCHLLRDRAKRPANTTQKQVENLISKAARAYCKEHKVAYWNSFIYNHVGEEIRQKYDPKREYTFDKTIKEHQAEHDREIINMRIEWLTWLRDTW